MGIVITGTGSYIPNTIITNDHFGKNSFYTNDGELITESSKTIAEKLENITGINERRYIDEKQQMYEIAAIAATRAIANAKVDPETLDSIILAHNFGSIAGGSTHFDLLPSIASRVKHALRIKNANCIAFDIIFGCPGWLQGVILARQHMMTDNAKRILVIGADTLSRVVDPHDRDSMIYADGAAAVILEAEESDKKNGIISVLAQTYSYDEAYYLYFGGSNKKGHTPNVQYIKMHGKKIYEFTLKHVPMGMKTCLDRSGIGIEQIKKIFIHQANQKMDEAILRNFYKLYDISTPPENIMPMNIHKFGNSSVATIPTLLDMVLGNVLPDHKLEKGDAILMASVGAGMNVNAVTYIV
jgi:3-oxoacyl-[acyl-carrier-protein] synthase-3